MGSARRSELAGRFQPSDALSELTRLADFVHRRLSAARAGVEGRGRKLGLEQRPHSIVAADDRVPCPGALLLEAMHDVPQSLHGIASGSRTTTSSIACPTVSA